MNGMELNLIFEIRSFLFFLLLARRSFYPFILLSYSRSKLLVRIS